MEWGIQLLLQSILLLDPFMYFFSLSFVFPTPKHHTYTVERIICPKMLLISKWNLCTNSIFIISMKITEKENVDMKNLAVFNMYHDIVIICINNQNLITLACNDFGSMTKINKSCRHESMQQIQWFLVAARFQTCPSFISTTPTMPTCDFHCNYAEQTLAEVCISPETVYGSKFRIFLLLYWLTTQPRDSGISCYLTHRLEKGSDMGAYLFQGYLCENEF